MLDALRTALTEALASEATLAARQALFLAGLSNIEKPEYAALAQLAA